MSNVHGLFSKKKDDNNNDSSDDEQHRETRFVGGVDSRGGGSGLAVEPNYEAEGGSSSNTRDGIFNLAEQDTTGGGGGDDNGPSNSGGSGSSRRTIITMYRDGFQVDDGPYRRLDDPNNADFLRSLAQGRTPKELYEGGTPSDVTVGLVDKRNEDYVETFRSFSGAGTSLGSGSTGGDASNNNNNDGIIDPTTISSSDDTTDDNNMTSIQVRLMNGKRCIIKISIKSTILQLSSRIIKESGDNVSKFTLTSGYPPKPITDLNQTIDDAKLQNSQIIQKKSS